ncbi:MAG: 3-isopropylmalate dehydratase small subunit [Candidatus Thermoplasmatota archaeon]|nr:3-isopropylmalate dehydratase small subunit [Candidatus Thermoplasmatota archaeon]MBU1940786.1 3-isopropylmalate dehydratase small subunit [Candidatus Thermoplasmatota archaeon]
MIIRGRVYCLGDAINTDVIIPGRFLTIQDPYELARKAFADSDPLFLDHVAETNIIVAGENFGCGSSREQAAICLKFAGVKAIVSSSFARIFFRNAINVGLPVIECSSAVNEISAGDTLTIDVGKGVIKNRSLSKQWTCVSYPEWMVSILTAGGYISYIRKNKAL